METFERAGLVKWVVMWFGTKSRGVSHFKISQACNIIENLVRASLCFRH